MNWILKSLRIQMNLLKNFQNIINETERVFLVLVTTTMPGNGLGDPRCQEKTSYSGGGGHGTYLRQERHEQGKK